jgi:two-component system, cell cycle sensor histidine kinase and response regulator CckA
MLGLRPGMRLETIDDTLAVIHSDDRAAVAEALATAREGGDSPARRFRVVRPLDGEILWFERRGQVSLDAITNHRWLRGILMDVTAHVSSENALRASEEALRRAAEQLRQSQKIEAVGRLAGGIAHDFNNILSVILRYGELLLDDMPTTDPRREDIEAIRRAGRQAAELTRQLLAFSRQQVLTLKVLDLNEVVSGANLMLRRLLGETVDLSVRLAPEPAPIRADVGQLDQVVMNLAINARDAMPDGGQLTIETTHVVLDAEFARQHLGIAPGPHVMLAVSDTGLGMDREVQSRIFEPFFTTKERGKGTGLGLSTVLGIVQQTGGSIWVYSELGQGTTFKVYIPRARGGAAPDVQLPSTTTLRGSETVLLVEDQDEVREVARQILRRLGYEVLEAPSAAEALAIGARPGHRIDLLLTDVVMPQMSGRELAERLVPLRPDLRVLFMSGYTEDAILQHRILESGFAYLQKPLVPEALGRRVREVLTGPPTVADRHRHQVDSVSERNGGGDE